MVQVKARLIYNRKIRDSLWHCLIEAPGISGKARPGEFVSIKLNQDQEALLRRPFSIHRSGQSRIEILYQLIGKGTKILSQKKAGEFLDIIGPLGKGFDYRLPHLAGSSSIIVAGGMGVAPLMFLAEKLKAAKNKNPKTKNLVLIGGKTKRQILCENEFKSAGYDVRISTDDGSWGFKGRVTDLLAFALSTVNCELLTIYACGPKPMLKEIAAICGQGIRAQVSLEEHMACGIGACFGCAVNTKSGYKRVCKEGPVFSADEIIWE